jgi:hypothetical protein
MSSADILKAAKQLISTPDKWTKGVYARNVAGDEVKADPMNGRFTDAVSWCAVGSIREVCGKEMASFDGPIRCLFEATDEGWIGPTVYNDTSDRTHEEIMALFDQAIEIAEKELMP